MQLQSYFYNDDSFNFNYAQAKAAVGNFKEAEEVGNFVFTITDLGIFHGSICSYICGKRFNLAFNFSTINDSSNFTFSGCSPC